jgi:hypothetical protein
MNSINHARGFFVRRRLPGNEAFSRTRVKLEVTRGDIEYHLARSAATILDVEVARYISRIRDHCHEAQRRK